MADQPPVAESPSVPKLDPKTKTKFKARKRNNAKFQGRLNEQNHVKLSQTTPIFPTLHVNKQFVPWAINCSQQDQLRQAYWSVLPAQARVRNMDETANFRVLFSALVADRINGCQPHGAVIFAIPAPVIVAIRGVRKLPKVEAELLKMVGIDPIDCTYPMPINLQLDGNNFSVFVVDNEIRYLRNGQWEPLPLGGLEVTFANIEENLRNCANILNQLERYRSDQAMAIDCTDNRPACDRACYVRYNSETGMGWTGRDVAADQFGIGIAAGFGINTGTLGCDVDVWNASFTCHLSRPLAIQSLVRCFTLDNSSSHSKPSG